MPSRLSFLRHEHRGRLRELLDATGAFSRDEVGVALELFDDTFGPPAAPRESDNRPTSYEFVGSFAPDGELAGYACYGSTPGTDRTYDLYWIAVDPRSQGRGTGSDLLGEVERRLRESEARLLVVETSSRQEYAATRRFYEGRGYGETARVRDFYAPGDDRVLYCKRVTHPHMTDGGVA